MKKITLKNIEIKNILDGLNSEKSIVKSDTTLPINILWEIDKNHKKLSSIGEKIEERTNTIQQKYSSDECSTEVKDENDNVIGRKVKPEYMSNFLTEINDFMILENEVEIGTIKISDLSTLSLSGKDFQSIKFMIDDDDNE
jgi:hypothetical protein